MAKRAQLAFFGESLERLFLPEGAVAVDVIEHLWLQYEEAAVDPAFARLILLGEVLHFVAGELEAAESCGRAHRRDGRQLPVRLMELDELLDVDIAHAVAVSQAKRF